MLKKCGPDIEKFCSMIEPGGGRVHSCLRDNLEALSSDCKALEKDLITMEAADVRINPIVREACSDALVSLCSKKTDTTKKESNVSPREQLLCLQTNIESKKDSVAEDCKAALRIYHPLSSL